MFHTPPEQEYLESLESGDDTVCCGWPVRIFPFSRNNQNQRRAMVFPRYTREEQDPEVLAENEMNIKNETQGSSSSSASTPPTKPSETAESALLSQGSQSSISAGSNEGVSKANGKGNNSKETKAERKKRSRGISGSSIKKDGGRFDLGMEDFANISLEERYDEGERARAPLPPLPRRRLPPPPPPVPAAIRLVRNYPDIPRLPTDPPSATSEEWQDALIQSSLQYHNRVRDLFFTIYRGEHTKRHRMQRLAQELYRFYEEHHADVLAENEMSEYFLCTALTQTIFEEHLSDQEFLVRYIEEHEDDHVTEVYKYCRYLLIHYHTCPLIPQPSSSTVIPASIPNLARDLVREHNVGEIAQQIPAIPNCFRSLFIKEALGFAVSSMSMDVMYFVVTGLREMYDNKVLSDFNIRIGFARLVRDVPEMEKDLPAAASLVHLLMSYAIENLPVTEACFAKLPPPKHFLSMDRNGKLCAVEPNDELPELNLDNYFLMN